MAKPVVLLVLVLLASVVVGANADFFVDCKWTAPSGHEFDLASLNKISGELDWSAYSGHFHYYLNVCGATVSRKCPVIVHHGPTQSFNDAVAIQMQGYFVCVALGSTEHPAWQLIDPSNPNVGVSITYDGGQSDGCSQSRSIKMIFYCSQTEQNGVTGKLLEVKEPASCQYEAVFETPHACPTSPREV